MKLSSASFQFTKVLATALVVLAVLFIVMLAPRLLAQDADLGLTIRPAISDIKLGENLSATTTITLVNNTTHDVNITATTGPFAVQGTISDKSQAFRYDASSWLELPLREWTVTSNQAVTTTVNINAPEDTAAGGYFAQISFRASQQLNETDVLDTPTTLPEIVALIFIDVAGEDRFEQIALSQSLKNQFTMFGDIELSVDLTNSGNTYTLTGTELVRQSPDGPILLDTSAKQFITPGETKSHLMTFKPSGLLGYYHIWAQAEYGEANDMVAGKVLEVIYISPELAFGGSGGLLIGGIYLTLRSQSINRLAFNSRRRQKSRATGHYRHPLSGSERKHIRLNK